MPSVTTEAAANVSFQSAQPSSQRGDRSSDDTFGTLVNASVQGSPPAAARSGNSRNQFKIRPDLPRPDRVMPEPTGGSRASSARPPQVNSGGAGKFIRQSALGAEASSAVRRYGVKHDDPEIAATENASDSMQAFSGTDPIATPPAAVVPVTSPVAGAPAESASAPVPGAAEQLLPAQQTGAPATSPANAGINLTLAIDTEAVAAAILQETPGTQQAAQTTATQTGDALAAAHGVAKPAVKTLDNVPPGRTTASVTTGIQPGPEAPVLTTPPAAGGDPVSPHDSALADRKHDAAENAKNVPSDTGTSSTEPATAAAHPARALDVAAPQSQPGQVEGQSINNALAQPQNLANATTPATPQYNVAAAAGAAVPLNGLAVQIAVTALSGRSRFEIRLDPADLGRIDVRLDVDRQGRVTSHLTVEKPETLAMLRQDAPQLQRALQDAGLKTGDGGLQFSLRDQSSQGQTGRDDTGRNAQRLIVTEDDIVPAATAGRSYGRMLGSSGGLDIRV